MFVRIEFFCIKAIFDLMMTNLKSFLKKWFTTDGDKTSAVPNSVILTGLPRAGTTLTCKLLSEQENIIGLNEPIAWRGLRTYQEGLERLNDRLGRFRHTLLTEGKAPVRGKDGKITDNHFERTEGARKRVIRRAEVYFDKPLTADFKLFVKHNSVFTQLLPDLMKTYPCYAIIRNPLAVLGSWSTVTIPVSRGTMRHLDVLNPKMQQQLDQMDDLLERQLFLLDFYFMRYAELEPDQVVRYESVIDTQGKVLEGMIGQPYVAHTILESKNVGKVYNRDQMLKMGEALLKSKDHHCWSFYQKEEVEQLYQLYEQQPG